MADLEQVFLYVTQRCNIRCVTCYALEQLERSSDLAYDDVVDLLRACRARGAWRLSFLGGEPTVYPRLAELVHAMHSVGFTFVRVNTNGMFNATLLADPRLRHVNVLCFSIDGATADVNDAIRKGSRLERVVANMRQAVALGYEVRANITITACNIAQIFEMIALVQDAGGVEVNLNVMFRMGYALDRHDLSVSPTAWRAVYQEVRRRHREFTVRIKVPPAFATLDELPAHRANGHRCLALDGSRLYVASNGDAYPCLAHMDDRVHRVAEYATGALLPLSTPWMGDQRLHEYCHFIQMDPEAEVPLCIFYKDRLND